MTTVSGYKVARCDATVYVRAIGLANMKNTPMLDAFLREQLDQGASTACIDLSACNGMDSTFMGTLVAFHHRFTDAGGKLVVCNPTEGNRKLLEMLGVSAVLPVVSSGIVEALEFYLLESTGHVAPVLRARMMKEAHEHLVSLSESNRAKFSAFLGALEADLKRLDEAVDD